jgi:hypothetical protein
VLQVNWKLSLCGLQLCPERRQDVARRQTVGRLGRRAGQLLNNQLDLDLGHQQVVAFPFSLLREHLEAFIHVRCPGQGIQPLDRVGDSV